MLITNEVLSKYIGKKVFRHHVDKHPMYIKCYLEDMEETVSITKVNTFLTTYINNKKGNDMKKRLTKKLKGRNVVHITHTDMDGVACRMIMQDIERPLGALRINPIHADYQDLKTVLEEQVEHVLKGKYAYMVITDLGIDEETCEMLSNVIPHQVAIIDHHPAPHAKDYEFYHLITFASATGILADMFKEHLSEETYSFCEAVNNADIYICKDELPFKIGQVCSTGVKTISSLYKDLNMEVFGSIAEKFLRNFKHTLLLDYIKTSKYPHVIMDDKNHSLIKASIDSEKAYMFTLQDLYAEHFATKLCPAPYMDNGVVVLYIENVKHGNEVADTLLTRGKCNIIINRNTSSGSMSARSDGTVYCNKVMQDFCGGGGHVQASGGLKKEWSKDTLNELITICGLSNIERMEN